MPATPDPRTDDRTCLHQRTGVRFLADRETFRCRDCGHDVPNKGRLHVGSAL
ncbi:MAG TPA: hypothetical protein VK975_01885 [Acidimicrobiales bacterium]|nr:hypothetical protein [Acidimicrobiales bacterium]